MQPKSIIYVGFGGFGDDVDLPEMFEEIFGGDEEDEKVLNSGGRVVEWEEDTHDEKFFRKIRGDWSCYGFVIGDFDTADILDINDLCQQAERWLVYAQQIGRRRGIAMEAKIHILSYIA